MTRAIEHHRFNTFSLPIHGMGGGSFHSRVEPTLQDFAEETPQFKALFRGYARAVEEHLRERGWLDEAFVYWFDEPDPKDYEYLAILRGLLRTRGGRLAEGEKETYAKLLEVPETITKDLKTFTKDPAPIETHRRAVAGAIEALARLEPAPSGPGGAAEDVLAGLREGHPRLYVTPESIARLKEAVEKDPAARKWRERLEEDARMILGERTVERKLVGPRLLGESRAALRRVSTLAGLFLLDGDRAKAERARKEMLAAAAFTDWNPSHFLDVAEMTNALAIGYDWLFGFLSAEDRAAVRAAIVEKGLKPGLAVYASRRGWPLVHHNWNQVCNGGLAAGALAIAGEEPAVARGVLGKARVSIPRAMASFAPDGGWAEGPGYWNYATHYNVFFLSAAETALATDFGLAKSPGFAETGFFRIHSVGPLGLTFNYADAGDGAGSAPQMLWLSRRFREPAFGRHETALSANRPDFFHLAWFTAQDEKSEPAALPLDALFRGVDVAFFRSAWNDRQAVYVAVKSGDNRANHSHLDLGSFVLDALGERWAVELGGDDYNLPGYFGKKRWEYYRLRTEGQNTLVWIAELINRVQPGNGTFVALDAIDHFFLRAASPEESYRIWKPPKGAPPGEFNPALLQTLRAWLDETAGRAKEG